MIFELCKKVFKRYYLCLCSNSLFLGGGKGWLSRVSGGPHGLFTARVRSSGGSSFYREKRSFCLKVSF